LSSFNPPLQPPFSGVSAVYDPVLSLPRRSAPHIAAPHNPTDAPGPPSTSENSNP
jgi:hypothetical protein